MTARPVWSLVCFENQTFTTADSGHEHNDITSLISDGGGMVGEGVLVDGRGGPKKT